MFSRRVITLILSLFVLAVLPVVSLYYSFQGASLRKHAMAELTPKGNLPETIVKEVKPGLNNLYLFTGNCSDTAILKPLIDQFKAEKVRFVFVGDSNYQESLNPLQLNAYKPIGLIQCIAMPATAIDFNQGLCEMIMTNQQFQILRKYDLSQASERTKIIEHLALMVTKK